MQTLGSTPGFRQELLNECMRAAYLAPPPVRGGDFNQQMPATVGIFRGDTVEYIIARAQRLPDGTPIAHFMPVSRQALLWLGGNVARLASYAQGAMVAQRGDLPPFVFEPQPPDIDEQNESLLTVMRYCKSNTKLITGLTAALIQASGVGVLNAPPSLKDRLAFVQGLLMLLPLPARVAITFATSVTDAAQVRTQVKFFDTASFPPNFVVFDWVNQRIIGDAPDHPYAKFIVSQLRLDTSIVVEQNERVSRTAVWRAMRKDDLANALSWIARRSALDGVIMNNQPANLATVASILREDPTLPEDLRVAYARHLVTFAVAMNEPTHTEIIPTVCAQNQDVTDAVYLVLENAAMKLETAQAVFKIVEGWVLHPPLGAEVDRWRPLLSMSLQSRFNALAMNNDHAGLLELMERLVSTPSALGLERTIVELIRGSYRRAFDDARLARVIFLLALAHLSVRGIQQLLGEVRYVAQLPPLLQEAVAALTQASVRAPKPGLLARASDVYGSETQPLILGRMVEWAFGMQRYDLLDSETLLGMVKVAASPYGDRFDALVASMSQQLNQPDIIRRMPPETLHRLIAMTLVRGRVEDAVMQMQVSQDTLFRPTEQWRIAELGRVAMREAPLEPRQALATLSAVQASSLRTIAKIAMHLGALEGQRWSPEMEPAARSLTGYWANDPRQIALLGVEPVLKLLQAVAARKDRVEALRLVSAIVEYALAVGGDSDSLNIPDLFGQVLALTAWSPEMSRAVIDALAVYVRRAPLDQARQAAIVVGERHGQGAREALDAAYVLRQTIGGQDFVAFTETLSTSVELLTDLAAVYFEGQDIPQLAKLRRWVQGAPGGMTDGEKRRIGQNFGLIAPFLMQLYLNQQNRNAKRSRADNDQIRSRLMNSTGVPTTALEAVTWLGGHFSKGRVADLNLAREAPPHLFGSRSLNMVLRESDVLVSLLQGMIAAFPERIPVSLELTSWQAEVEEVWAQIDLHIQTQTQDMLGSEAQRLSRLVQYLGSKANERNVQTNSGPGRQLFVGRQQPRSVIDVLIWMQGFFLGMHEQ
jgi:hypothetical protein